MSVAPRPIGSSCDLLEVRYPSVKVEPDPIFVHDGPIWTSAGLALVSIYRWRWCRPIAAAMLLCRWRADWSSI
jgi:hypothetical protein